MARVLAAALIASTLVVGRAALPGSQVSALSTWTGGIDLYRSGVFTTQKTWLWCTAADVQIMRNIVDHQTDHTRASQQRYFDYMRAHDRYRIPVKDGVDPAGWTAGLRHYVDSRYRLVASGSFNAALRSAVTNLRKTNRPVGITVAHGNHAWVLTGFTATADPAKTSRFTVTSVRVTGPLWGLQSRTYGYDMAPDRKLTPSQLRGFFTPVALRAGADGLGRALGLDPGGGLMIGRRLLEVAESLKPDPRTSTDADAAAPVDTTDGLDPAPADPADPTAPADPAVAADAADTDRSLVVVPARKALQKIRSGVSIASDATMDRVGQAVEGVERTWTERPGARVRRIRRMAASRCRTCTTSTPTPGPPIRSTSVSRRSTSTTSAGRQSVVAPSGAATSCL